MEEAAKEDSYKKEKEVFRTEFGLHMFWLSLKNGKGFQEDALLLFYEEPISSFSSTTFRAYFHLLLHL